MAKTLFQSITSLVPDSEKSHPATAADIYTKLQLDHPEWLDKYWFVELKESHDGWSRLTIKVLDTKGTDVNYPAIFWWVFTVAILFLFLFLAPA